MRANRIETTLVVAVLGVALLLCQRAVAQAPADLQLAVPANAQARSGQFELTTTSELTVRLEQAPAGDGVVRVYVFDQAGVLWGLDDPDVDADVFTWSPPAAGRYFVNVVNTNSALVSVRISVTSRRGEVARAREFATVRVLFATNRTIAADTAVRFGSDPSADLSYGYCDVSIPRDHRMGELEAPSIWRLEFREDPEKHVTVLATETQPGAVFFKQLTDRVARSPKKETFVFVHGFNVAFMDAAKRTAQIAYDLAFDGPPIAFSWPSQGTLGPFDYTKDQRNADLSAQSLEEFLLHLKAASPQLTIHLVAHSMGNRVLARALELMGAEVRGSAGPPLQEVAMMAPDLDAELFRRVAGKIAASAAHVTLYASSQDLALKAAQRVAGYPRAGEGGARIVVVRGIETVDASDVETSVGLKHAYYADNSTILSDLFAVMRGTRPNDRFGLRPMKSAAGNYWQFRPSAR